MTSRVFTYTSTSEEETTSIAQHFASLLSGGQSLGLSGTLGAGKSVFARGLARGLGVNGIISSPSYPIILEYPGEPGFCHMDWYRLSSEEELDETGAPEYLGNPDWVCLVEWWNKFPLSLDPGTIAVHIDITGPEERRLEFTVPESLEECIHYLTGLAGPDDSRGGNTR